MQLGSLFLSSNYCGHTHVIYYHIKKCTSSARALPRQLGLLNFSFGSLFCVEINTWSKNRLNSTAFSNSSPALSLTL